MPSRRGRVVDADAAAPGRGRLGRRHDRGLGEERRRAGRRRRRRRQRRALLPELTLHPVFDWRCAACSCCCVSTIDCCIIAIVCCMCSICVRIMPMSPPLAAAGSARSSAPSSAQAAWRWRGLERVGGATLTWRAAPARGPAASGAAARPGRSAAARAAASALGRRLARRRRPVAGFWSARCSSRADFEPRRRGHRGRHELDRLRRRRLGRRGREEVVAREQVLLDVEVRELGQLVLVEEGGRRRPPATTAAGASAAGAGSE